VKNFYVKRFIYLVFVILFFDQNLKTQEGSASSNENLKNKRLIVEFHENGTKKHEHVINENSQMDGPAKWYFSNGDLLCIKNYKNGILDGKSEWYHDSGNLQIVRNYKNGKLHGIESLFSSDGIKTMETEWLDGKKHGLEKEFYESGELKTESRYELNRLVSARTWTKNGILSSRSIIEPSGKTKIKIYDENGLLSETVYNKNGDLGIIIDYNQNTNIPEFVEYRKTVGLMPSAKVLLKFLGKENEYKQSDKEPENYEAIAQECIVEILNLEKNLQERSRIVLREGLLLYLISKAQNASPLSEEYIKYRIITYMLLEVLPENIQIIIQGVDFQMIVKEFEQDVKLFNKKLQKEIKELAYSSEIEARENMVKLAKLTEPSQLKIEEVQTMDLNFIKDQYERTKNANDHEFKNKRLLQIKNIIIGFYKTYYTDQNSQKEMDQILEEINQTITNKPDRELNNLVLRSNLERYLMADHNQHTIESLVSYFINAVIQKYEASGEITQREADLLFGVGGVYDFLVNTPEKDIELLQLASFFYLLKDQRQMKKYAFRSLDVVPYFKDRINYYGIKTNKINTSKDFRLFRAELISKNTRMLRIGK
jgi:antitoxin component YwqK of YwqJK toxin-antitoxin module